MERIDHLTGKRLHLEPNVLHLISSLRVGGAERLLASSLSAARQAGFRNFAVLIMNDEVDMHMRDAVRQADYPCYELMRQPGHVHPCYLRQIQAIIKKHDIEVVHSHNNGSCSWAMALKMLNPSLKLVHTVHSTDLASQLPWHKRLAYRAMMNATIAISPYIEAEAHALGLTSVHRIENGIDLSAFQPRSRAERTGPLRIASVGRFAPVKGQDILIDAVRIARARGIDVALTLAGVPSEPAYFSELEQQVATAGLADITEFIINPPRVQDVLASADVFVLSSREEGFGLALIEAMAAGVPVIGPDTGGVTDLVTAGADGLLFETGNPEALARTIATMASDAALRKALSQAGPKTAQRYDIHRTVERHLDLYRTLAFPPAGQSLARST